MVNFLIRPPPNSNCAFDGDLVVANLQNLSQSLPTLVTSSSSSDQPGSSSKLPAVVSNVISALPLQNTLYYIAGYVARKVVKAGHECSNDGICCVDALVEGDKTLVGTEQTLTHYKALAKSSGDFGGLTLPSNQMFIIISKCEDIFVKNFDGSAHLCSVRSRLSRQMPADIEHILPVCDTLLSCIVTLFNRVRIHAAVKFVNSRLGEPNAPRKDRKMFKILHL